MIARPSFVSPRVAAPRCFPEDRPARAWCWLRRAAIGALALGIAVAQAQGQTPLAALLQHAADPACVQAQTLGPCQCGPLGCGVRVTQFVPVAFIETTRAPGDTLLGAALPGVGGAAAPLAALGGTASSSLSATDNTAEVHVWTLPDAALPLPLCASCRPSDAALPAAPTDGAAPQCGPPAAVAQALSSALAGLAGPLLPVLAYASEADLLNWRTGCRDLAAALAPGQFACAGAAGAASSLLGDEDCLGAWGPLKPRQMRDIGPTPVLYSAKTAVRAMSIARTQLGTFAYPVDVLGRLQQVYPVASACFRVGTLPLPQLPWSLQPTAPSLDGRYGWIYWRRTTCCVRPTRLAQCLRAGLPGP